MEKSNNDKRTGAIIGITSSLYMALAYAAGIVIFIVILKYPQITEDIEKVRIAVEMKPLVFLTNLFMYVLFGPVLVLFILFLKSKLESSETLLVKFASVIGFIWAGSLTAAGMIANGALEPVARLFNDNPDSAVLLWQMLDTVSLGLGNGNGEILGGVMSLGFGISLIKDKNFHNRLGVLGIIVGVVGIISLVPMLTDLAAVFGILQLIWFILIGFSSKPE